MTAAEARQETIRVLARMGMSTVYDTIRRAVENGLYSAVFLPSHLTSVRADILRAEGYKIDDDRGEPMPTGEHRPILSRTVSW